MSFENERAMLQALIDSVSDKGKASDLAVALLEYFGNLNTLLETMPSNMIHQLPENLSTLIALVPPLYQRRLMERFDKTQPFSTMHRAFEYLDALYVGVQYEQVCLICLDREFRLINHCLLSEGSLKEVPFYPRRVLQEAFRLHASAIILCHNHPTGWSFFSESDVSATRELLDLCTRIRLPLLDHLLIANDRHSSMRCRSFIPERTWLGCSPNMPSVAAWRGASEAGSFVFLPDGKSI